MSGMSHEFSAKNVDAAIAEGLRQLNVNRNEVEIEILHEGSRGLLGIGSSNARIRIIIPPKPIPAPQEASSNLKDSAKEIVDQEIAMHQSTPKAEAQTVETVSTPDPSLIAEADQVGQEEPNKEANPSKSISSVAPIEEITIQGEVDEQDEDEEDEEDEEYDDFDDDENKAYDSDIDAENLAELASSILIELLEHMGFDADVEVSWPEKQNTNAPLDLNVVGENLGMLIGRHGETLASIQYLLRLMVNQRIHRWTNIIVDVDGYKARRAEQLAHMASRMAEQVVQTGRAVALEPMPASERRLVHIALRNHAQVYTESIGEADRRKVQILPK